MACPEQRLQAANPAVVELWDTSALRPKSENELSDWLKRSLDNDLRGRGVIVGREVQIRPGPGGEMGEAGDLVVEAIAGEHVEGAGVVSVTIEVKGWHVDVDDAMRAGGPGARAMTPGRPGLVAGVLVGVWVWRVEPLSVAAVAVVQRLLRDLVARGRAAAVIVVAATQKSGADVVPSGLRDLFGFRLGSVEPCIGRWS